ncbi:MAG TPA: SsrA-binding protein SmpB [Armatimonadetes bacterium]|nr:SsrA-binding protein SmpB [Armatimonadota bacterium]
MARSSEARKVIMTNRRARHDYHILETYEAGLVLRGPEVKSLRQGKVNLQDSYARIENGEAWLYNMHISPYEHGNRFNPDPRRPRKLLLHKHEIRRLLGKIQERGLTLVPLQLYFVRGLAKVELGLARGKAAHDKRRAIRERDLRRDVERQWEDYRRQRR